MHRQGDPSPMLRPWVPFVVLAVGLVVTLTGVTFISRTADARAAAAFEAITDDARHLVDIRLNAYIELLRAGAAFLSTRDDVSTGEFRAFVRALRLAERYPGIQGLGFAVHLTPEERTGPPGPFDPRQFGVAVWPEGERSDYTSIVLLEPPDERNQRALGYDMFTEPVRRAAMVRARDTGEPAASGRVTLVQETSRDPQAGFLIYVPVYRGDRPATTVAERQAALLGYVYAPFRGDDLFTGMFTGRRQISLQVYGRDRDDPESLLYRRSGGGDGELRRTIQLDVAGQPWTLVFDSGGRVGPTSAWLVPAVAVAGAGLSVLLFFVMRSQQRTWDATRRMADARQASEEALRETSDRLRRLVALEREARADAQRADRAKDDFLATLSHELRTPLNAMLGWITMLRSGKVRAERQADALEVIERNARVQAKLIEDLLDVSRIIAGKIRLETQPVSFGPIVTSVADALRPAAEQKGVRLNADIATGLPAISGDPARLQQIVANLISNAIKFTPAGGEVSIALRGDATPITGLVLEVRDTGVGIGPEFLPHVFERFRQADSSTTRAHGGVGLGLAIVRHLVELHGGTVEAFSDGPNTGARFVARFPNAI